MAPLILIVDDERDLVATLEYNLQRDGYQTRTAYDGASALEAAQRRPLPDLVLLDLMLPDIQGTEVCRRMRSDDRLKHIPVVMLTAKGEEIDRVVGFELGADDYVVKPFSLRSLVARIEANVRRARGKLGPVVHELRVGELLLSPGTLEARLDGEDLHLTAREFSLLHALAERAGRVVTRDQLLGIVHGSVDEAFGRSIDIHVSKIRQKLGDDPRRPRLLKTVRGKGYLYAVDGP